MTSRPVVLALLFGGFTACTHAAPGGSEMHAALADADAENGRHARACEAASSLPLALTELDDHERAMDATLRRMDGACEQMGQGMGMGMGMERCAGRDVAELAGQVDDLAQAMADHAARMRAVPELADAHLECGRHASAMALMVQGMSSKLDSMACVQ